MIEKDIRRLINLVEEKSEDQSPKQLNESTGATDYNPTSQGGTRKELLAKYHKTNDPKDAEAARKAGATQQELKQAGKEGVAEGSVHPGDLYNHVIEYFNGGKGYRNAMALRKKAERGVSVTDLAKLLNDFSMKKWNSVLDNSDAVDAVKNIVYPFEFEQDVAEGVDPATYPARAKEAHEKYLKYENLVAQELRKFGQRLPKAWDASTMVTKLSSDPKYALALKYYNLSEKFASLAIRYKDLAKKKQGMAEGQVNEMDSEGYTGSRDKISRSKYGSREDYSGLGREKEGTGTIVEPGDAAKHALEIMTKLKGAKKKKDVEEGEEMGTFAALKDWREWNVSIMNNFYRGKYADYSPRPYSVVASSPEEARQVVLDNPDYVLQDLLSRKLQSGKRVLPRQSALPIEDKRVGSVKPGSLTTMGFKEMLTPNGPMKFKFNSGKIVASQDEKQDVAEDISDIVKGVKRKVAGKADSKDVEKDYGVRARQAIDFAKKSPTGAAFDDQKKHIDRYNKVSKVVNKEGVTEGSEWETRHDEFVTIGDRATPEHINKIVKALIGAAQQASGKRGFINQIIGKKSNGDLARMAHAAETLAKNIQRNSNAKPGSDERKELGQHLVYAVSLLKRMSGEQDVAEGLDSDTQRLEQEVRDALNNGDDYTAKQLVKMASTPEAKKYLLKIIKQEMYGTEPGQGGVMEGTETKWEVTYYVEIQSHDERPGEDRDYDETVTASSKEEAIAKVKKTAKPGAYNFTARQIKQDMAEGLDPDKRSKLDDLIDQYRNSVDPSYDPYDSEDHYDSEDIISQIRSEFGDKIADQVEAGAEKMHFGRPDHKHGYDPLGWRTPIDRQTKAGKMFKQDSDYRKNMVKSRYKLSGKSATESVAEGGMPASVIKQKERLAAMSDKEFAEKYGSKSDEELMSMARRHGYGANSKRYVEKCNKGKEVSENKTNSKSLIRQGINKAD